MLLALTLFIYKQDTASCEVMLYLRKRGVFAPLFKKMTLKASLLKIIRVFAVHRVVLIKFRINQRIKI